MVKTQRLAQAAVGIGFVMAAGQVFAQPEFQPKEPPLDHELQP